MLTWEWYRLCSIYVPRSLAREREIDERLLKSGSPGYTGLFFCSPRLGPFLAGLRIPVFEGEMETGEEGSWRQVSKRAAHRSARAVGSEL